MSGDDLLSLLDEQQTLTLADLDELIARVSNDSGPSASYVPFRWVIDEFERILGREVPLTVLYRTSYLELLTEVRQALAGAS